MPPASRLFGEGANLGLGDVVEGESLGRLLFEGERLVFREHNAELVVAHLLRVAVEPPVVPRAAGVRLLRAFRHDDGRDLADLRHFHGEAWLAVARQTVDLGLEIVGQAFADDVASVPHAEEERPALGVGKGRDVLVDAGRVPLLELHGKAFALADEEFHLVGSDGTPRALHSLASCSGSIRSGFRRSHFSMVAL